VYSLIWHIMETPRQRGIEVALIFGTLITTIDLLFVIVLLQCFIPRKFTFHFDECYVSFTNVPGYGTTIPFSEIESVDILEVSQAWCCLGLKLEGKRRRLRVTALGIHRGVTIMSRTDPLEVLIARLQPLAKAISKLIEKPVRTIEGASFWWLSWR